MSTDIAIPFAGQKLASAFAPPQGQEIESLSEGIGSSYAVIGYKGKVWSLRHRGERHTFTRTDDGSPLSYIDVIMLRQGKAKAKSYYPDGYSPESSEGKRPTCNSLNGLTPDADAVTPQAQACALCPRNVWKTDATGKKSRECTDYKRLAVLLIPSLSKQLLGQPLIEPCFLRVPPASLNDLSVYGDTMASQGYPFWSFVTRISFDPTVAHPKFIFKPVQLLTNAEAPVVMEQREDPMAKRITGEEAETPLLGAPEQRLAAGLAQPATPQPEAVVIPLRPAAQVQPETVAQPAAQEQPGRVDTGFLELTANPEPAPVTAAVTPAAVVQQVNDTGDALESDAALDAKINALLPK